MLILPGLQILQPHEFLFTDTSLPTPPSRQGQAAC
jgi:hypothetical protein